MHEACVEGVATAVCTTTGVRTRAVQCGLCNCVLASAARDDTTANITCARVQPSQVTPTYGQPAADHLVLTLCNSSEDVGGETRRIHARGCGGVHGAVRASVPT